MADYSPFAMQFFKSDCEEGAELFIVAAATDAVTQCDQTRTAFYSENVAHLSEEEATMGMLMTVAYMGFDFPIVKNR